MPTAETTAAAITAYITDLRARAAAAGKASDWMACDVGLHLFADGSATIGIGRHECGGPRKSLAVAMAEAEEWLTRDELAELNATLGIEAEAA